MAAPTRRYHIPSAVRRSSLRISPAKAHGLLAEGAVLTDARRIPPDEIPGRLAELPRDRAVVLACT
jgi:hypothetical protein